MTGKSVAGGSAIVVVSPLISRIEDQCSKIGSVTPSTMWLRRHHLHPPPYEYVLRLQIIKRMCKQWKPGPFLLPLSGLGTRLGEYILGLASTQISAVILLLNSTLIVGGRIIANYCGLNNRWLSDYWVEKYVACTVTCGLLQVGYWSQL